jgi:predicted O-methyltransferase YrrM
MTRALVYRAKTGVRSRRSRAVAIPYASHVPILAAVARCAKIERVLELGCGRFSTLTFLDRSAFRDLVHIDSLEDDAEWMKEIQAATSGDSRIALSFVEGDWEARIANTDFSAYDLVFVDNGRTLSERQATIRWVAAHADPRNIVVMHDYEQEAYRVAARSLPHRVDFPAYLPNTGVGWKEASIDRARLMRLRRLIAEQAAALQPEALNEWTRIFDAALVS